MENWVKIYNWKNPHGKLSQIFNWKKTPWKIGSNLLMKRKIVDKRLKNLKKRQNRTKNWYENKKFFSEEKYVNEIV